MCKKNKFKLLFLLLFWGSGIISQAQEKKIINGTPEAGAISKFINFPVGYNTGVPNISIPLHEVKTGGITLPVTLSYHAGGFKVGEMSTNVGMGWSLSTDLQITRAVKGGDDLRPLGYYYNNIGPVNTVEEMLNFQDQQPDQFHYTLLGKSGTFCFRKSGNGPVDIVTIPYTGVKVQFIRENCFKITDTDGTVYWFGSRSSATSTDEIERTQVFANGESWPDALVTAWKCTAIIDPASQDEIQFQYSPKNVQYAYNANERIEVLDKPAPCRGNDIVYPSGIGTQYWTGSDYISLMDSVGLYNLSTPKYFNYSSGPDAGLHLVWDKYVSNGYIHQYEDRNFKVAPPATLNHTRVYGQALSNITFRGGKLVFQNAGRSLNSINIYDSDNNLVKTIDFYQAVAQTTLPSNYSQLNFEVSKYLNSVTISKFSAPGETYTFNYFNKYPFNNYLKGSDAWGGVNNATQFQNGPTSVPMQYIDAKFLNYNCFEDDISFIIGNGDKLVDPYSVKSGILQKITYPTGGSAEFEFAPNKYKDGHGYVHDAGGLRIEKIKYFDKKSEVPSMEKIYKYGELVSGREDGAGKLMSAPSLNVEDGGYSYKQILEYVQPAGVQQWSHKGYEEKTTYLPNALLDPFYATGAPVHYTEVTEYQSDRGKLTGKTTYTYDKDPYNGYNPYYLVANTNMVAGQSTWHLGKLQSETQYKYANGAYDWVKKKSYEYTTYEQAAEVLTGQIFHKKQYWVAYDDLNEGYTSSEYLNQLSDFDQFFYGKKVGTMLTSREVEQWKENGQELSKSTKYYYDASGELEPTRIESSLSGGQTQLTYIKYPSFYAAGIPFIDQLKSNYKLSYPIEKITTIDDYVVSGEITTYKNNAGGQPDKSYLLKVKNPVHSSLFQFSNISGFSMDPGYEEKVSYEYDAVGNPVRVQQKNVVPTGYIWGYDKTYPIAECKNATEAEFFYTGFEDTGTPGTAHTGGKYNNGSYTVPFSIPNGRAYKYSYWYRNSGTWMFSGELNYTGSLTLSAGDAIDDVRVYPEDAQLTTYTYKPMAGVSSATDAKGLITYYDFDELGRLKEVRDHNGNLLKTYEYNYSNLNGGTSIPSGFTFYGNDAYSLSFTKNDCTQGGNGESVLYTVPAGKYTSTISVADANAKAAAEAAANGQQFANMQGRCTPVVWAVIYNENEYWADLNHAYGDVVAHFYDNNWNSVSVSNMQLNYYTELQALYDTNYILNHKNAVVNGTYYVLESNVLTYLNVGGIGPSGWYERYPEEGEGYNTL